MPNVAHPVNVRMARWRLPFALTCGALPACYESQRPPAGVAACVDAYDDDPAEAFDDHTVGCLNHIDAYFDLAGARVGTSVVKFDVMAFSEPSRRHIRFLDSTFYRLHDEWYYFRLINGEPFEGDLDATPYPGRFDTIEAVYSWAVTQSELPIGLAWSGERLYAPRFYELAFAESRYVAPGTLIHIPDLGTGSDGLWAFELEHSDDIPYEELQVYFEMLAETATPEISDRVKWLVRSAEQEALAQRMEHENLPYADRVVRYDELIEPGETEIYNPGITAGRIKIIRAGELLTVDRDDHILVLEHVPDALPPAHALITSAPQTPLAHINLLARSRGIPNASVGGIAHDPAIDALARVSARVAVLAEPGAPLQIVALTNEEYAHWSSLREVSPKSVPPVDFPAAPSGLDLSFLNPVEANDLRPLIGGKAAGMVTLLATPDVETPARPFVITARPYAEHVFEFLPDLKAVLSSRQFRVVRHRSLRYLVLEGEAAYDARYPSAVAQREKEELLTDSFALPLARIVARGGLRALVADKPIDPQTLAMIEDRLRGQFGSFTSRQALRFRSSSSVEDIDGFNGAGLYASHSGFLDPSEQPDPNDRSRTASAAIRSVWASYWGAEAFEERMLAKVDHLSGNMAVLVHARFDNDFEFANGVVTLTRFPGGPGRRYVLEINAQRGNVSVTNPDSKHFPEVVRVVANGDDIEKIERVQFSTVPPANAPVLSDAEIRSMLAQTQRVSDAWLDAANVSWPDKQAQRAVVLDFEFRRMGGGWPMDDTVKNAGERIVTKQARTLDPDTSRLPTEVVDLAFPRDVLARAVKVERRTCETSHFVVTVDEALTDPFVAPDLGHAETPFVAQVAVTPTVDLPGVDWQIGETVLTSHLDYVAVDHTPDSSPWSLAIRLSDEASATLGIRRLAWDDAGSWELTTNDGDSLDGLVGNCTTELHYAAPDLYLREIIDRDAADG
ncbi:MAG: PEP/pyruvate-binding domain-containing protein [Nannocystaceae bacterium]